MKQLLVYINPRKWWDEENNSLIKVQIDNSFDLGWEKENILLVTNFDYEYRGIKSLVVGDDLYIDWDKPSSKIPVITYLLNQGTMEKRQLYWYHDFDAYQNNIIEETELELDDFDLGLTTYTYKPHWNCGVFFFRESAGDIFNLLNNEIFGRRKKLRADEKALKSLTDDGIINKQRYKIMNTTYNIQYRDVYFSYRRSKKPLKVLHFHPYMTEPRLPDTLLNTFMYGKNRMGFPLMTERLIKIFHSYGIK